MSNGVDSTMISASMKRWLRGSLPWEFLWGGLLVLLVVSFAVLYQGRRRERRVFFFPDASGLLVGEKRMVPRRHGEQEEVRVFVDELLLGPASVDLGGVAPRGTRALAVIVRNRTVYLNLSSLMVLAASDDVLPRRLQAIADNLYFNFPRVKRVNVFVNGRIPLVAEYSGERLRYAGAMVR